MARRHDDQVRGPSQRQLRVGEVIRRSLSDILIRGDVHEPDLAGVSVTVSEVRTSPDLKIATAFVMPLGGGDAQAIVKALARAKGELRHLLGREIDLKYTPDLRFRVDETFDRMDETRAMLSQERVRRDLEAETEIDPDDAPEGEADSH